MIVNKTIVKNYSAAILENSISCNEESVVLEQMSIIHDAIFADQDIKETMCSPIVVDDDKIKIVESIVKAFKISPIVEHLLILLIKNARVAILPNIIELYQQLLDEQYNIKRVAVTSAKLLAANEQQWLQEYLEKYLQQKVRLSYNEDSSIIGGLIIEYDSMQLDYSIAGALKKIARVLKASIEFNRVWYTG